MNTQKVFPSTNRATEYDLIQMEIADLDLLPDTPEVMEKRRELQEKLRNIARGR